MPKKSSKKGFDFFIGKCDFCGNTFTKIRQYNSGYWVCEECYNSTAHKAAQEYQDVIDILADDGSTIEDIASKIDAILLTFRYNHNLLSPREKRWFEKEIKEWKRNHKNDNWGNEDNEHEKDK